jgi:hypothetical protein
MVHNAKRLTQRKIIDHIEVRFPDESVNYGLPEAFGRQLAMVEYSTRSPWDGSKYVLSTQILENGKLVGEREKALESAEEESIATWLYKRGVKLLSSIEN